MLKCHLLGHAAIDPRAIWYDGMDYRSNCPRCDKPMIQDFYLGVWRLFRDDDYHQLRDARPLPGARSAVVRTPR